MGKPQANPNAARRRYAPEFIAAALCASGGLVSVAAKKLQCQSSTIHQAVRKSKAKGPVWWFP